MKVVLPSKGVLGKSVVTLRQPTYGDIRALNEESEDDEVLNSFIKSLVKCDFSKITYWDLQYLLTIVVFQMSFNKVATSVKCSCGKVIENIVSLDDSPLIEFNGSKVYKNIVDGTHCQFHLLTAQQHFDAVEYALQQDDYNSAYEAAIACFILGKTLSEVDSIKYTLIAAAILYHRASFHGVRIVNTIVCPECNTNIRAQFRIVANSVRLQVNQIMGRYVQVADMSSFEDFLKMTVPEYSALIQALNAGM